MRLPNPKSLVLFSLMAVAVTGCNKPEPVVPDNAAAALENVTDDAVDALSEGPRKAVNAPEIGDD